MTLTSDQCLRDYSYLYNMKRYVHIIQYNKIHNSGEIWLKLIHTLKKSYCNDDVRYCQNAFGCLPVADIVKRRTCKFLQKFDVAANVVCQACTRRWYSIYFCHCLFKCFFCHFLLSTSFWWNKVIYINVYLRYLYVYCCQQPYGDLECISHFVPACISASTKI